MHHSHLTADISDARQHDFRMDSVTAAVSLSDSKCLLHLKPLRIPFKGGTAALFFSLAKNANSAVLVSIVDSISACHAEDHGLIP